MDQSMMNSDCKVIAEWFGSNCTIPLQVLRERDTEWHDVTCGDALYPGKWKYRIKPLVINDEEIKGICRVPLIKGVKYYTPYFGVDLNVVLHEWENTKQDRARLHQGVVFLEMADAAKCAEAMIKPLKAGA